MPHAVCPETAQTKSNIHVSAARSDKRRLHPAPWHWGASRAAAQTQKSQQATAPPSSTHTYSGKGQNSLFLMLKPGVKVINLHSEPRENSPNPQFKTFLQVHHKNSPVLSCISGCRPETFSASTQDVWSPLRPIQI